MSKQPDLINQVAMALDHDNVSFDPVAFDLQSQQKGSLFEHWINIPCPNGNFSDGDVRSSHTGACCQSGRIYRLKGQVQGILTQVNKSVNFYPGGTIDHSTTYMLIPRFYSGTQTPIYVSAYDKFVPKCSDGSTLWTPYWEQVSISSVGVDPLTYPAEQVELLIDAAGKEYTQGVDFDLKSGQIVWRGQNRPTESLYQQAGQCYSVRYFIKPAWICQTTLHEIRTIRTADPISGEPMDVKYPMFLLLQKEVNFFSNKNRQPGNLSDHFAAESSTY